MLFTCIFLVSLFCFNTSGNFQCTYLKTIFLSVCVLLHTCQVMNGRWRAFRVERPSLKSCRVQGTGLRLRKGPSIYGWTPLPECFAVSWGKGFAESAGAPEHLSRKWRRLSEEGLQEVVRKGPRHEVPPMEGLDKLRWGEGCQLCLPWAHAEARPAAGLAKLASQGRGGHLPDKIFSLSFFPFLFPRGSSKIEEACEIYARAANMFKMAKNWSGTWSLLEPLRGSVSSFPSAPYPKGLSEGSALQAPFSNTITGSTDPLACRLVVLSWVIL